MKVRYGNMLQVKDVDVLVVSTNGFVTKNNKAVMGRGIAEAIARRKPELAFKLGKLINKHGNKVLVLKKKDKYSHGKRTIVTFPVKPVDAKALAKCENVVSHARKNYSKGDFVPGFHAIADTRIIIKSCKELVKLADANKKWKKIIVPRFGCGAGELEWEDIRKIMMKYLDDRFICYTYKKDNEYLFVSGSMRVTHLPKKAKKIIDKAIVHDVRIMVGDCTGVDTIIQKYLAYEKYDNVKVYHINKKPRNNLGFGSIRVTKKYKKAANQFSNKDIYMGKKADSLLVIWDGKSRGSEANVKRAKKAKIPCKVVKV